MLFQKKYLIGQELVRRGLITQDDLDVALIEHERRNVKLGKVLIALGFITDEAFLNVLSDQLELPIYPITDLQIPADIIQTVSAKLVHKYKFIPVKCDSEKITICMSEPLSMKELDEIRMQLKKGISIVIDTDAHVHTAIQRYYGRPVAVSDFDDEETPQKGK